ncbi:MAG: hypothetical protein R2680_14295 [Nitrososphaeraceae archaeon]
MLTGENRDLLFALKIIISRLVITKVDLMQKADWLIKIRDG